MRARALSDIGTMPIKERLPVLAEGMALLIEHVNALRRGVNQLAESQSMRAAAALGVVMSEEAAKILILLDLARTGWLNQTLVQQQLRHFSDHVARGIYIEVTSISLGTFGEIREYVETLRVSHYLDGPNDIDWVFRNRIESAREEALYVDYVRDEGGHRWISPQDPPSFTNGHSFASVELVQAMDRMGLLTLQGLEFSSDAWGSQKISSQTSWVENAARSREILTRLGEQNDVFKREGSKKDVTLILDTWTFPLGSLRLTKRKVTNEELNAERERSQAQLRVESHGKTPPLGM